MNEYITPWLEKGQYDPKSIKLVDNQVCNPKGQCTKLTRAINQCKPARLDDRALDLAQKISGSKRRPNDLDFVTAISVAFRGNIGLYISCNPTDIATSTWNGGFTSCHRPGGEYFSGNVALINTPCCMVAYVGTPEKKTGRLFMYYVQEAQHIYQLKTYGTLPQQWRKAMRNAVQDILDPEAVWVHSTKRAIKTKNKERTGAYVDTEQLSVCYQQEKGFQSDVVIDMGEHICPSCGVKGCLPSGDKRTGGCKDCPTAIVCSACGCGTTKHKHYDDKNYCEECYDKTVSKCRSCGDSYYKKDIKTLKGADICTYCFENHVADCIECGDKYVSADGVFLVGDDGSEKIVCRDCYMKVTDECRECGCRHDNRKVQFEGGVCEHCLSEAQAV